MSPSVQRGYDSSPAGATLGGESRSRAVVGDIRKAASLPIVCARHHVLLIDELDAVDGAPGERSSEGHDPAPAPPWSPALRGCHRLTGGRRRQAGTPQGSSTRVQSRPGPQLSHSTPCPEHPALPQRPGARSWRRHRGGLASVVTSHMHTRTPSPHTHSQRLHVGVLCHIPHLHRAVVGRAVELVGASTERQPLRDRAKGVWSTASKAEVRPREDFPKDKSHGTGSQLPGSALWGTSVQPYLEPGERSPALTCPWSRCSPLGLGPPSSSCPFTYSGPLQCRSLQQSTGPLKTGTLCLIHPIPQDPAPSLAHSGAC